MIKAHIMEAKYLMKWLREQETNLWVQKENEKERQGFIRPQRELSMVDEIRMGYQDER